MYGVVYQISGAVRKEAAVGQKLNEYRFKSIITVIFILLTVILNAGKISDIKGTRSLKNYNEIKDLEVKRMVDYDNYDEVGDLVYVHGENEPFTGLAVRYENEKITGLYFYENGKHVRLYLVYQWLFGGLYLGAQRQQGIGWYGNFEPEYIRLRT